MSSSRKFIKWININWYEIVAFPALWNKKLCSNHQWKPSLNFFMVSRMERKLIVFLSFCFCCFLINVIGGNTKEIISLRNNEDFLLIIFFLLYVFTLAIIFIGNRKLVIAKHRDIVLASCLGIIFITTTQQN